MKLKRFYNIFRLKSKPEKLFEILVNGRPCGLKARRARSFAERLAGLGFRKDIRAALLFENCRAIHTFTMLTTIDIVFIDRKGRAVETRTEVKPFRAVLCGAPGKISALELPAGKSRIRSGDTVSLELKTLQPVQ